MARKGSDGPDQGLNRLPRRVVRLTQPQHLRTTGGPFPHLVALDGLRGVAVALVVGYHLFGAPLRGGFLGVDVFFVLSGFLITSLLVAEVQDHGRVRLGRFYVRRARRLLPAMLLVLLALAAYATLAARSDELARLRDHSLWVLGYASNWKFVADGTTYTDVVLGQSPLRHTWSLAIEEQFYVLFPLLVIGLAWLVRGQALRLRRALLVVSVVGALASAGWMAIILDPDNPSRGYFGTDTRAHALLVGVGLGALLVGRPPATGGGARLGRVSAVLGVGVLAVAVALSREDSPGLQRGGFLLVAIAAAGIIAGLQALTPLRVALSFRPLVLLGLISYGVYLWHWPVIVLLDGARTGLEGTPLILLQLAVTLALSIASYVLVERPIRRGVLGRAHGRVAVGYAPAAIALVAVVVVASTVVPRSASDPSSVGGDVVATIPEDGRGPMAAVLDRPIELVMFGDSVAHTMAGGPTIPEFQPWRPEHSPFDPSMVELTSVAKPACSFLPGLFPTEDTFVDLSGYCDGWQDDLRASVEGRSDAIVVVANANDATDRLVDGTRVELGTPQHERLVAGWLDEVRSLVEPAGAEVVLVALPPRTTERARSGGQTGPDERLLRDELRAYASDNPEVRLLDLSAEICPADRCDEPADGFDPAWRYDGLHFNREGAVWVGEWLLEQLLAQGAGGDFSSPSTTP